MRRAKKPGRIETTASKIRARWDLPDSAPESVPDRVYDLKGDAANSDEFYRRVQSFSTKLLAEIEFEAAPILDDYIAFLRFSTRESPRSRGEYALELLTLGMALKLYASAAARTPGWVVDAAQQLLKIRRRQALKPTADFLRACLFRFGFATVSECNGAAPTSLEQVPRLLRWLESTGEFVQETARLQNWYRYLLFASPHAVSGCLRTSACLFDWFSHEAAEALGSYTHGVRRFLGTEYARRRIREDRLFCGRKPVEYHLGMVAAEIMNRALQPGFNAARNKVVLVPTCMRGARAETCQARTVYGNIVCAGCDKDCAVNRISRRLRERDIPVYMVPHASSFSQSLERWQREPDTGVVAVACALNILAGGYEMRARNIPSQCVLLDHPGCHRHWCRVAIPTEINEQRLVRIVTGGASN